MLIIFSDHAICFHFKWLGSRKSFTTFYHYGTFFKLEAKDLCFIVSLDVIVIVLLNINERVGI